MLQQNGLKHKVAETDLHPELSHHGLVDARLIATVAIPYDVILTILSAHVDVVMSRIGQGFILAQGYQCAWLVINPFQGCSSLRES